MFVPILVHLPTAYNMSLGWRKNILIHTKNHVGVHQTIPHILYTHFGAKHTQQNDVSRADPFDEKIDFVEKGGFLNDDFPVHA